jgi:hypothetical protein
MSPGLIILLLGSEFHLDMSSHLDIICVRIEAEVLDIVCVRVKAELQSLSGDSLSLLLI